MLTREQARHLYDQGFEAIWLFIQAQQAHNRMVEERLAALEARQGMGSHNSSKPPSSDSHRTLPKFPRGVKNKCPGCYAPHWDAHEAIHDGWFLIASCQLAAVLQFAAAVQASVFCADPAGIFGAGA